jgi:benzoyl-CoA reductase/2-hydroxyglutaryl-CoA dehydratase subunit BcrC/BadD/HgdB
VASAISTLTDIYRRRDVPGGLPVIGVTSNTVPWELLRAAGFQPFLLSPRKLATPLADRYMEDVFSPRIKAAFDFLLSGEAAALCAVVIPRTSEQEHKLYLYLREVIRQGAERSPRPILYNLLHTRSAEAQAYGLERTRELKIQLEQMSGRSIELDAVRSAIQESNRSRDAIRSLLQMREGRRPKLSGSEALALIGAWYFMDRAEYTRLAHEVLREIESRGTLKGPRILVKGTPQDNTDFCAAVESHGAVVVAEDDWWGSRAAGRDIELAQEVTEDPLQAIFKKYYFDAPSPRVFPAAIADEWFCRNAQEVDGVIFYLPPDDDVLGWDYPRLHAFLDAHAIPQLMLRGACDERTRMFIESLRHG